MTHSDQARITVVAEMNDGSLLALRQTVTMVDGQVVVEIMNTEDVDKANVKCIAGNFPGWGEIPPIPEWTWHYSFADEEPA